jgi:hypothetical protein
LGIERNKFSAVNGIAATLSICFALPTSQKIKTRPALTCFKTEKSKVYEKYFNKVLSKL